MAKRIAVCGLGYVGLPVAVAFSKRFDVIGFDVDKRRIASLKAGDDWTGEIEREALLASPMQFTDQVTELQGCDFFVVAVPTGRREEQSRFLPAGESLPFDRPRAAPGLHRGLRIHRPPRRHRGHLRPRTGKGLRPALRRGLQAGLQPERINPGDREHPLEKIVKIVSGQDQESLDHIAGVYEQIIDAGVHRASSIKVAEAAKVLENTQRDVNIALMNEMSKICDLIGIRTADVLNAAGTKWNFLKFTPGLVGGHCIGVDPYYLTSKAQELGYHPEVILSGRRINDGMASHVGARGADAGPQRPPERVDPGRHPGHDVQENVPDIRNSKVVDLYRALGDYGITPVACDPMVDVEQMQHEYGISLVPRDQFRDMDVLILAVPHRETMDTIWEDLPGLVKTGGMVCDLKSVLDSRRLQSDLLYWTL